MLAEIKPDLVAITTPSGSHFEIAGAAIAAGAHVLVEKPLTLSLQEADALLAAAGANGVQIAVGHIYRFFPMVQSLCRRPAGRAVSAGSCTAMSRFAGAMTSPTMTRQPGAAPGPGRRRPDEPEHSCAGSDDLAARQSGASEVSGWIDRKTHRMEAEDFGLAMLRLAKRQLLPGRRHHQHRSAAPGGVVLHIGTAGEIRGGILAGKPFLEIRDRRGTT